MKVDLLPNRIRSANHLIGLFESLEPKLLYTMIYVDANAPTSPQTGDSWNNAFNDLQSAIAVAVAGDEIHVAGGVYKPGTTDQHSTFQLNEGVTITGGFNGYGPNSDIRDLEESILSGDMGTADIQSDNAFHVVTTTNTSSASILDHLVITRGYANGSTADDQAGGGLFNDGGSPKVRSCIFRGNRSTTNGGAIYSRGSPAVLFVYNCVFVGNQANTGGALYNDNSSVALVADSTVASNLATSVGGIANNLSATSVITNSIINLNSNQQLSGSATVNSSNVPGFTNLGLNNTSTNPGFCKLPKIGVDSVWGTPDDYYGILMLGCHSPMVDIGDNSLIPVEVTNDIRGFLRVVDYLPDPPVGDIVDIGAYEKQAADYELIDINVLPAVAVNCYVQYDETFNHIQIFGHTGAGDPDALDPLLGSFPAGPNDYSEIHIIGGSADDKCIIDVASGLASTAIDFRGSGGQDHIYYKNTSANDDLNLQPGHHIFNSSDLFIQGSVDTQLLFPASNQVNLHSLTLGDSLEIPANGNRLLSINQITIAGMGDLDLHDNSMVIDYGSNTSPYSTIRSLLNSGVTLLGGSGHGIGSTEVDNQTTGGTMLGLVDDGEIGGGIGNLGAHTIAHPESSILIKYTWFGDSNLDGSVDGSDYALVDTGFTGGGSLTGWVYGDFDYNGIVDGSDYALIDTGFIMQDRVL